MLRAGDDTGTVAFAVSGSVTAASCGMDLLGSVLVGTITAVGGGTLRDSIVLTKKPFWVEENEYLVLAVGGALLAFLFWDVKHVKPVLILL